MSLGRLVNTDGARGAGPLLHGWARRTVAGRPSTPRQLRALVSYLPTAQSVVYASLGGHEALDWAQRALDSVPHEEPPTVGDNEILVLGLPYGGPNGGRDLEDQFFSPMTDFMDGVIERPPVMYTHGTQNGFAPEPVGEVRARWYDRRGGWFKVWLDPQSERFPQLMEAHATDNLRASSGAVPAASHVSGNGHIDSWLVGELSMVDLRDGFRPINAYAITKATDVLFEDYYGDPVEERGPTLLEKLKAMWDQFMLQAAEEEAGYMQKADFGGRKRSELDDSDFIFPDTRSFPVVTCQDFADAVSSWGRYEGSHSFDEFKRRMIARANKLDCTLPEKWQDNQQKAEEGQLEDTEKCESCDEAAALGEALKAELIQEPARCARCPEAIRKVREYVKAGRITPKSAFEAIDRFTQSDEGLDEYIREVEAVQSVKARTLGTVTPLKAELHIAGGQGGDPDNAVDEAHMNKQRRLLGLPQKETK